MTIDIDKAKRALANLEREKHEQQDRLQLAAEAKQRIDETNAHHILSMARKCFNGR